MLVGSVLPLWQRSIGKEEGAGGIPAGCWLREPQMSRCQGAGRGLEACRRPQACSPRSARRLRGGRSPRVTDVGRSSSPAPMPAPAALMGPSERPKHRRHRRVAHRRAELGSQAAIMLMLDFDIPMREKDPTNPALDFLLPVLLLGFIS
ncbi:hypothetical protein NDU88_007007 [Pleurodeles waltl]|uniref:Uncharacterized protein n=1 Tax=Pleurodeles waltl TaxID=8319 RepID=A0AAV7QQ95_PLEWA|nr:hypothetical protein NDU88_007007 [Pleurodeles waltl]